MYVAFSVTFCGVFWQPFQDKKAIRVGIYCIALYEDELYYRAKLVSFKDNFHVEVSVFQGLSLRAGVFPPGYYEHDSRHDTSI